MLGKHSFERLRVQSYEQEYEYSKISLSPALHCTKHSIVQ